MKRKTPDDVRNIIQQSGNKNPGRTDVRSKVRAKLRQGGWWMTWNWRFGNWPSEAEWSLTSQEMTSLETRHKEWRWETEGQDLWEEGPRSDLKKKKNRFKILQKCWIKNSGVSITTSRMDSLMFFFVFQWQTRATWDPWWETLQVRKYSSNTQIHTSTR